MVILPPAGGVGGSELSSKGCRVGRPLGRATRLPKMARAGGGRGRGFYSLSRFSLFASYCVCCLFALWFAVGFSPFILVLSFRLRYYCTAIFQHTNPAITMANISTIIIMCSLPALEFFFTSLPFCTFGFSLT